MVDRPVLKENQKETKSKTRKRSRNRPKQKETLCRNQCWKTVSVLVKWKLERDRAQRTKNNVHRSDYDMKVVHFQEANPARNVIQRGDTHETLPTSPEWDGSSGDWTEHTRRTGTARCVPTSEVSKQYHKSSQRRVQNKCLQRLLSDQRCDIRRTECTLSTGGVSVHVMGVDHFTSLRNATWNFKPRSASSVPP